MAKSSLSRLRQKVPSAAAAKPLTLQQAQARTKQLPWDPSGWKQLGQHLRQAGKLDEARGALQKAAELAPDDHEIWILLGQVEAKSNNDPVAQKHFQRALDLREDVPDAHQGIADIRYRSNDNETAVAHVDRVLAQKPNDVPALSRKVQALTRLNRFDEAAVLCDKLILEDPRNGSTHWNDLGNINRDLGLLQKAEACYTKAASLTKGDPVPMSNRLTLLHYMPDRSADDIMKACKEWGTRFAPTKKVQRPVPADPSPSRKLRLGMFSDGFRQHPVGAMTTPALEELVKLGVEIYFYSTNSVVDSITRRLMAIATRWTPITSVGDEELAQRIRDDGIDILMDLSGHNAGNRIRTMTLQPAPLLVKWVGGLINTTGVEAIDYLLTDAIESPPGSDSFYTEKLIRMPDDYICYMPPGRVPDVGALPALRNGFVTFGCFNNPTKVNEVVLEQWARLLHEVPASRLFLKGGAFGSTELRQRTLDTLQGHGIVADRVRIEGNSPHYQLFQRYNEVDVALDPWPYSGGLTTCEAMLMGVPVVTLPGPTFAGRHSATHLINARMPELVTQDWDQYRARAVELVGDLQSLSTIRSHLRQMLLQSPVCDGRRFARNLADALRAIWQRYCEGKPPAALAFTQNGLPYFDGDDSPMILTHPEPEQVKDENAINFAFQGKIVTLDHGGTLVDTAAFSALKGLNALETIAIDPAGRIKGAEQYKSDGLLQHYHAMIALGDGTPGTLYACLDDTLSGTLEPLAQSEQLPFARPGASVLGKLPLPTVRLDGINGLEKVDWLALHGNSDNAKILEGAGHLLPRILVVAVTVTFARVFKNQPHLRDIEERLAGAGFRLLRLEQAAYRDYVPGIESTREHFAGSQLLGAKAVFVPDEARIRSMDENQRRKLAFILHSAYGASDFAYHVLRTVNEEAAAGFLKAAGWVLPAPPKKRFVHICYNNMHVQGFMGVLAEETVASDFTHEVFIEKARSVPGYDNDIKPYPNAAFFNAQTDLQSIVNRCLAPDVAGVFVHGLFFDWQKQLILQVGPYKKLTWIIWGGDLYGPIRAGKPIKDVARHVHAVATGFDGDYRLFCETYGEKPRLRFGYPSEIDFHAIEVPAIKAKKIFVGNSGDPGNMHKEVLTNLARKKDIGDYELILPVAYNFPPAYEKDLRAHIEKLGLSPRTRLLTDFMGTEAYFTMLADAEIYIAAHNRQQAMGNLVASLYFGNKTVLRQDITIHDARSPNPGWQLLTEQMDTRPITLDELFACKRLSDLPTVTGDMLTRQRTSISEYCDKASVAKLLRDQFTKAAAF